ncbi:helix-turn-helix domain-containing protein [Nannocystaceae bacterium ST9]
MTAHAQISFVSNIKPDEPNGLEHHAIEREEIRPDREAVERRYMAELGRRLRTAREQRGMTQKQAAEAAGIATDMISRLENGHYQSPGLRTLLRIADGLGTSVAELLPELGVEAHTGPVELSQRARLAALTHRADPRDLELIVEIAGTIVNRRR